MSKYKIGIVVTWFGNLPPYFPAWLKSAEYNNSIDFLFFSDQQFESQAANIKIHYTTLESSIRYFEKKLGRKIYIKNSYKFCDCRAFFGILYEDYLKEYDFWGYCDIDLVFGNIRKFLTDERLEQYDRFYQYGHLSVFRNVEYINNLYLLPGSIYSLDEVFKGKAKVTFEEYSGLNRICQKNNIAWYVNADFADFIIDFPKRMEVTHYIKNYEKQVFVWHNGRAYRIYQEGKNICEEEFIYMHWQKKKPKIQGNITNESYLIITGNQIVATDMEEVINDDFFEKWNPVLSSQERDFYNKKYRKEKLKEFYTSDLDTKKIWLRQKFFKILDKNKRIFP